MSIFLKYQSILLFNYNHKLFHFQSKTASIILLLLWLFPKFIYTCPNFCPNECIICSFLILLCRKRKGYQTGLPLTLILSTLQHSWNQTTVPIHVSIPEISYLKCAVFVCLICLRTENLNFQAIHSTMPLWGSWKLFYPGENEIEQEKWGFILFNKWKKGRLVRINFSYCLWILSYICMPV